MNIRGLRASLYAALDNQLDDFLVDSDRATDSNHRHKATGDFLAPGCKPPAKKAIGGKMNYFVEGKGIFLELERSSIEHGL